RVRLLVGPRPYVHVLEMIILALEGERAGARPAFHHQIVRFLEARMRECRIWGPRVIFGADAAHHARGQPPAPDAIEHGVRLREGEGMLAQEESVAEDRDLRFFGPARECSRHYHRRRHQPIGVLVMLVDRYAVETKLGGELELVEIAVVELV